MANHMTVGGAAKLDSTGLTTIIAEHVYEKNLIRRFLYYVAGGSAQFQDPSLELFDSPLDSCMGMKNVFDSLTDQGEFTTQTAGQQLANALSCYGGAKGSRPCPDLEGRASELGLLESRLNNGKSKVCATYCTSRARAL